MWPFSGEIPLVTSAWPRPWAPVPQSSTTSVPPDDRSSTHEVFPPYRTVLGPGLAIEPRVPQKRTSMKHGFRLTLRAEASLYQSPYGPQRAKRGPPDARLYAFA